MFVVVAVNEGDTTAAEARLRSLGGTELEARPVAPGRSLLYGRVADDTQGARVVDDLRDDGWAAVLRPAAGGHLTAWLNHTRPVVIADRLWVCFPWSEFDRRLAPAVVEIDPGRAFGTGSHPSTRLLLAELADRMGGGETVLDVGCGSGVLSICAARLGASSVTAIDIRPEALEATRANAGRNGVDGLVEVAGTPVTGLDGEFDVILANIAAPTLVALAPALPPRLSERGWLGLSGLSPAQVSVVAAAFSTLRVESVPTEDDWSAVVARHQPR